MYAASDNQVPSGKPGPRLARPHRDYGTNRNSCGASPSLQMDIVAPEPVVDRAGVAPVLFCNLIGSPIPQQVKESKALRREDVAVLCLGWSNCRTQLPEAFLHRVR